VNRRELPPAVDGPVHSIAIIRALALGDMLCAVPSLRAIRRLYPEARISLVGLRWSREIVARFPAYLDEHIEFPGFPGIPEAPVDPARTVAFLAEMQRRRFDLVVQLHGSGMTINAFAALLGGARTAGFVPVGLPELADPSNGTWVPYPSHGSEVRRLLALPAALGASTDERLEFPLGDADTADLAVALHGEELPDGGFAVVHPGSSTAARRWPAERFAAVADAIFDAGLRVVLTGTEAEAPVVTTVASATTSRPIDLAGRTSLGGLAALLASARILVANDTGVSHLAAALRTPSVIVFSGSDRERWAPIDAALHVGVGPQAGNRCRHQANGVHRCLGDACSLDARLNGGPPSPPAAVEDVIAAAMSHLGRTMAETAAHR
jgi:ADP-heptose:LPS heptosyltransferase